ncbi:hypothetical protein OIU84_016037 [Salix udensis]|uniref:NAC domain-containing protein n=1 Tax=Salix udensis TaxID=889485 RepID=A0AAD6NP63_9ROSI|nr:hypothetical protein OIU84_016037 [Salix udensis]
MAEGTEKEIGVMRSLRFYEGAVRTGWMIYEFDLISEPSLFRKGQYVLCKLESDSEGVKSKKRKRSHPIPPVSRSEVEPSQSMDSDSKKYKPRVRWLSISPCDESGFSHQVGLQFGNQNSGELMNSSARQLSEFSHHRTSEFRNQIPDNLMSDLVHDGSGSSHSTVFNRENQYWNQPTVDSAYNASESPCMAFDSETQTPNELPAVDSAYNVTKNPCMAFDLANQNPSVLLAADSASNFVSESRHMTFDLPNHQTPNVLLTADNSASNVSGSHYMAFDLANKNLCNSISILDCENSLMASRGSEILEPPFSFPLEGEIGNSMVMPCSFLNQSTYDKSEPSSLIPFDFDYQNQSKEIDKSAFGEGVWSNITATPPDSVNQNPCKKPDMSAAPEEVNSSYSEPFFSDSYLPEVRTKYNALQIFFLIFLPGFE